MQRPPCLLALAMLVACTGTLSGPLAGPAANASAGAHAEAGAGSNASVAQLLQMSLEAVGRAPEESRQHAEAALAALGTTPDPDLAVQALTRLCDYHSERDAARAREQIARAGPLLPRLQRPALRAELLGCEGEIHEYAGENIQAMALYQQAVNIAEDAGDQPLLANALYQRGYLRGLRGEFALGLGDLKRAAGLYELTDHPQQLRTVMNAIAVLYNRLGDYAQAREHFERSLALQQSSGRTREQVVTQHNLSRVLENLHDWDAAERGFQTVLVLSRELDYPRGQAYGLRGLASISNARQQPAQALKLLSQADAAQARTPDERLRAQIAFQRGLALRQLERWPESLAALRSALAVFSQAESISELADTHEALAATLAAAGEWRGALEHQVLFKQTSDQRLRRQLDDRLAMLRIEVDMAARERDTAALQREKQATEHALAQQERANRLQALALALAGGLVVALAVLAARLRRTSGRMRDLALTDELTGLANRRQVMTQAAQRVADGRPLAAAIIDLDHFKAINDQQGHLVGDHVLRAVARALLSASPPGSVLGRLGGEEFLLLMTPDAPADAHRAAEALRRSVAALDLAPALPAAHVTISIGLAWRHADDDVTSLLRRADEALYKAKASGRNRTVADEPALWAVPRAALC